MDGYRFLSAIQEQYPQVVRIILSGHSDREMLLKSTGLAHQFLTKPCDAETLKTTIARACGMRHLLEDESLIDVVSRIESLPSLPSLYAEVMDEVNSPDGSLNRVGEIIAKDVGMSAKLLQLVNSSFFGMPVHVSNPVRAVNLLGFEIIRALVLSVKIFSQFSRAALPGFSIENLWGHSMATANLARVIAREQEIGQSAIDEAFMAGLLHDCGKLILLDRMPEKFQAIVQAAHTEACGFLESELKALGTTHAQVGGYLMGIWGFPESMVEAIAFHHSPGKCRHSDFGPLAAVHLADIFEHEMSDAGTKDKISEIDIAYMREIKCADRIESLRTACREFVRQGEGYARENTFR